MDSSDSDFNISLQEDLIIEILRRLPVKSIIRFCCVCKSWKTLVRSNDNFIKSHLKLSLYNDPNRTNKVLFYSELDFRKIHNLDQLLTPRNLSLGPHFTIVGSCNGIICCYNKVMIPEILMNLSLPNGNCFGRVYVVFFYDSINDDYQIAKFCHISESSSVVELYSLNSNTWKLKNFSCNFPPIACPTLGALYALDINEEKFVEISLPGLFNEFISLFAWGYEFEIWVLKERLWKKEFVLVDPSDIHSPYGLSSLMGRFWLSIGMVRMFCMI
ncbi:hypothetical protein M9H77_34117 [Catharanthus roseus]|uniref:Uncharacterized protein n=1 Tax=Catharanthus roseus TaxID=4058 RepID=A0ACB9ZKB1_CATRO|nr:hypothetical protein M9H77_34117 [Catharanthus roseus]